MLVQTETSQNLNNFGYRPSLSEKLKSELVAAGFDSQLCIRIKEEWSSCHEDYRLRIRENLYQDMVQLSEVSRREFEDLSRIPQHEDFHISISHCRTFGGYTYIPKSYIIGFDVECLNRVTTKIINRIKNPKDNFETVVNPAFVWVAKEAAFKAIQNLAHINVIQEVIIHSWNMISANVFEFQIANLLEAHKDISTKLDENGNGQFKFNEQNSKGCVIFERDSAFGFYLLNVKDRGEVS